MIVCLCEGVSERTIRRTIQAGARSVEEVGLGCGAGTGCGCCKGLLRRMVRDDAKARAAVGAGEPGTVKMSEELGV